jgi:hypothetical protein
MRNDIWRRQFPAKLAWNVFIGICALFIVTPSPAYPWGSKGHEIVAAIAETHLTDAARKLIKKASPARHYVSRRIDMAGQSWWPYSRHGPVPLHQLSERGEHLRAAARLQTAQLRIEAIAWYLQVLKSPDAPRNEKRTALRFIAHLVGDIHQPLHAGFAEVAAATVLMCESTARR